MNEQTGSVLVRVEDPLVVLVGRQRAAGVYVVERGQRSKQENLSGFTSADPPGQEEPCLTRLILVPSYSPPKHGASFTPQKIPGDAIWRPRRVNWPAGGAVFGLSAAFISIL